MTPVLDDFLQDATLRLHDLWQARGGREMGPFELQALNDTLEAFFGDKDELPECEPEFASDLGPREICLPCYGITISLAGPDPDGNRGGAITGDLHEADADEYNAAMDAIESLVLAHACAGVDVEDLGYIEGIETAVQAIASNL